MNKPLLFLLLVTASFSTLQAQNQVFRLDKNIGLVDLQAEVYSKDSTANAFYIFEDGYTHFREGDVLRLITEYTAKIKILNTEGYEHASISIPLSKNGRNKEEIEKLEATTYYLEDGVIKGEDLDPSNIYTEENPEYDLVKFTFPALRPGAVIVYSYEKESPFFFNFETWWFQDEIPKVYSRFISEIPGNFDYNIKKTGTLELDLHDANLVKNCFMKNARTPGSCLRTQYIMKDIPAFIDEEYLTSRNNFISRINYELKEVTALNGKVTRYTKSWKDVDKELRSDKDLGKQLSRTSVAKNVLPENIQSLPNNLDKAKAIYSFVKDNYKWNGESKIFQKMRVKDLLEEKSGNVSAINTLLHNIYKEEGFEVWPVLTSTRSNGMPTKVHPVLSDFNYLLVQLQVGQEKFLLDATEKYVDFGVLPFRTLNSYGRLLDFKNGSSWIDIEPQGFSAITFRDSLKINIDGTSTGNSVQSFSGYHALKLRSKLEGLPETEIFNTLTRPNTHTRNIQAKYANLEEISEDLELSFQLHNSSQKINDHIYVNPFSFQFFDRNPFQLKERTYPIDFGFKDVYSYSIALKIPEGHHVLELPEQKLLRLPESGGILHFMVQQKDERNVDVFCRITFPKAVYAPDYYPYLKEFFSAIIDIQKQSLIVVGQKA